ncbi:MAG: GAF domain-containing protein, partial [Candidatus Eremiobacterota bacterium]
MSGPISSTPGTVATERLKACAELAGFPMYWLNGVSLDESAPLPPVCRGQLSTAQRAICLDFHHRLRELAAQSEGPVVEICPSGLACFAYRQFGGGHVHLEGTAPIEPCLPQLSRARLELVARRTAQLLESEALDPSLNLAELATTVLDQAVRMTGARAGSISLVDSPNQLRALSSRGSSAADSVSLFVPLGRPEKVRALLLLEFSTQPGSLESLDAFVRQAGLAIETAQALAQEQQRAREATALYQAARMIEEAHQLADVLHCSAEAMARLAEVNRCLVLLKNPYRPFFSVEASYGLSSDQAEFFSAFRLHLSQLSESNRQRLNEGKPILSDASPAECQGLSRLFALMPTSNALVVPLLSKDGLTGLVFLDDSRGTHHFTPATIRQVMTLALQVANAAQRASLIEQLQANLGPLKALYQVSTAITGTLSLTKVIRLIVDQAVELLDQSACALLVLDEMGESFRLETS